MKATKPAFRGFARDAPAFFIQLAAEQNREWFAAHKHVYEALWVAPLTALMADVAARIKPAFRGLTVHPPKLFRIHRDVRFAKDKSPYKTHAAAVIHVTAGRGKPIGDDDRGAAALYVHLGAEEEYSGAGKYMFAPDALVKWRKLVADGKSGRELTRLIATARAAGMTVEPHDALARVPKPYDPEHPRAELLKYKGLLVGFPDIPRGMLFKPELAKWLADQAKTAAPLVRWLAKKLS